MAKAERAVAVAPGQNQPVADRQPGQRRFGSGRQPLGGQQRGVDEDPGVTLAQTAPGNPSCRSAAAMSVCKAASPGAAVAAAAISSSEAASAGKPASARARPVGARVPVAGGGNVRMKCPVRSTGSQGDVVGAGRQGRARSMSGIANALSVGSDGILGVEMRRAVCPPGQNAPGRHGGARLASTVRRREPGRRWPACHRPLSAVNGGIPGSPWRFVRRKSPAP